ncbi:hypothetical protein [Candidatus Vondammii sp. HM_W22]|uniref:hypothetical protein n=1 Tax=Candidatus Vondammii sp. HM_W22 TaxID=2687299 RepID=UPI00403DF376
MNDDQTEFQIRDRYSFYRFLGLSQEGKVPDATHQSIGLLGKHVLNSSLNS